MTFFGRLFYYTIILIGILIPSGALAFFIVSLVSFIKAKNHYRKEDSEELLYKYRSSKIKFIVSAIILAVIVFVIFALCILFLLAITNM